VPIDFGKIAPPRAAERPTDPIALFQSLPVTDPAINDLWLAQGDALRAWDKHRTVPDAAIVLNTGAGKTLVGLLAGQSLVNEASGHVVYACSSIQLVQQTASKARGYGLDVTTYVSGAFSNELYRQALAPCITTYRALFNGRSRFFADDVGAVVFDDAHTAGHLLRDQFTLRIARDSLPDAFTELVQLFRSYFTRIGKEMGYTETQDRRDAGTFWFVPPFAIKPQLSEVQRILREASLAAVQETTFSWEYLRDYLDLCAVFVSGTDVSFTPPVVPVRTLPYFGEGVRRLYLSATLVAKDAFLRTFGRVPDPVISPSTTAGECERQILVPALHDSRGAIGHDTDVAQSIARDHKCLVLVPTRRRAQVWDSIATRFDESVAEQVEDFKKASPPVCLVLTARYDGVDLPGDTCRVLVIDDLPTGLNPLERYLWERLGLLKLLRSTIASRVVQSFGRISRGMSDHGVVVLTGRKLVDWILYFWERHYADAAKTLERDLEKTFTASRAVGAWHALWLGYCHDLLGDTVPARDLYDRAHRAEKNIPPLDGQDDEQVQTAYSVQVLAVAASLRRGGQAHLEPPKHFDTELAALDGTGTAPQMEAALEALGEYLGLAARRPDNESGTGPDILWTMPDGSVLSMEAKTAKGENALYRKEDLGQLRDHRQWIREQLGVAEVHSAFVGPVVPASPDANPDPDMVVIELDEFRRLRDRLRAALVDICASAVIGTAAATVHHVFTDRELLWPAVYDRLPKHILCDMPSAR
jgi:hypothetical protein